MAEFQISFIRHAQSSGNAGIYYEDKFHKDDPPLSPLGLLQAQELCECNQLDKITAVFSSPLTRAVQTIYPAAVKYSQNINLIAELIEVGSSLPENQLQTLENIFSGAEFEDIIKLSDDLYSTDEASLKARADRCISYFNSLARDNDHFVVVSHGTFLTYLIMSALGVSVPFTFRFQQDNCNITRVIFYNNEKPKLSLANFVSHTENVVGIKYGLLS